jgi:hypothetical protein
MPKDRWLEMDLTWFDPEKDLEIQVEVLLNKILILLKTFAETSGNYGIIFNVGWLIDLVTEWTGDSEQKIPTRSRRTAKWAEQNYGDLRDFVTLLRHKSAEYGMPDLKVGLLFVEWAHVVWPPELKIYDFDSDWYARHPELYEPPKSFIGMPDLHPINRLHADNYPYAAFPNGIAENTYFPEFFGAQWGHFADFIGLDVIHLRDGFTGPMIYTRNGPYGTTAPSDPQIVAAFSQSVRDLFKEVKRANPAKQVWGYSSAISPIADWRVGCVDFESLIADGYIDGWIEQTWGGAWQDWWHQLWKGWTFQTANLLTRGAMIARANQQRQTPCKFYNLIETWDGWEPWDTLHQVPHKLRWAMWAFSHAAVLAPDGLHVPDGSYISWMNNGAMELLSDEDIAYINQHLNAAQESASKLEKVYGTTLVYNRPMMAWLAANHPDWNVGEWLDDQAAMLMKWGTPALSITRTEWLPDLPTLPDSLMLQTPAQLETTVREVLLNADLPILVVGRADVVDDSILAKLGIQLGDEKLAADFYTSHGDTPDTPAYDRPYIPEHHVIHPLADTKVHYQTDKTPLISSRDNWLYWQPGDWSEPFNAFVPKYQVGSTFPHFHVARLLRQKMADANLSYVEQTDRSQTIAFHLWRSDGQVYVLLSNLETGEFGDSRTPREVALRLNRQQLELETDVYHLQRVDSDQSEIVTPTIMNREWIRFKLSLPAEQCAVYTVQLSDS